MSLNRSFRVNISKQNDDVFNIFQNMRRQGINVSEWACHAMRLYYALEKNGDPLPLPEEFSVIKSLLGHLRKFADKDLAYFISKELNRGEATGKEAAQLLTIIRSIELQIKNTALIMQAIKETPIYIDSKRQATSSIRLNRYSDRLAQSIRKGLEETKVSNVIQKPIDIGLTDEEIEQLEP